MRKIVLSAEEAASFDDAHQGESARLYSSLSRTSSRESTTGSIANYNSRASTPREGPVSTSAAFGEYPTEPEVGGSNVFCTASRSGRHDILVTVSDLRFQGVVAGVLGFAALVRTLPHL
jgi:hypothetical protein